MPGVGNNSDKQNNGNTSGFPFPGSSTTGTPQSQTDPFTQSTSASEGPVGEAPQPQVNPPVATQNIIDRDSLLRAGSPVPLGNAESVFTSSIRAKDSQNIPASETPIPISNAQPQIAEPPVQRGDAPVPIGKPTYNTSGTSVREGDVVRFTAEKQPSVKPSHEPTVDDTRITAGETTTETQATSAAPAKQPTEIRRGDVSQIANKPDAQRMAPAVEIEISRQQIPLTTSTNASQGTSGAIKTAATASDPQNTQPAFQGTIPGDIQHGTKDQPAKQEVETQRTVTPMNTPSVSGTKPEQDFGVQLTPAVQVKQDSEPIVGQKALRAPLKTEEPSRDSQNSAADSTVQSARTASQDKPDRIETKENSQSAAEQITSPNPKTNNVAQESNTGDLMARVTLTPESPVSNNASGNSIRTLEDLTSGVSQNVIQSGTAARSDQGDQSSLATRETQNSTIPQSTTITSVTPELTPNANKSATLAGAAVGAGLAGVAVGTRMDVKTSNTFTPIDINTPQPTSEIQADLQRSAVRQSTSDTPDFNKLDTTLENSQAKKQEPIGSGETQITEVNSALSGSAVLDRVDAAAGPNAGINERYGEIGNNTQSLQSNMVNELSGQEVVIEGVDVVDQAYENSSRSGGGGGFSSGTDFSSSGGGENFAKAPAFNDPSPGKMPSFSTGTGTRAVTAGTAGGYATSRIQMMLQQGQQQRAVMSTQTGGEEGGDGDGGGGEGGGSQGGNGGGPKPQRTPRDMSSFNNGYNLGAAGGTGQGQPAAGGGGGSDDPPTNRGGDGPSKGDDDNSSDNPGDGADDQNPNKSPNPRRNASTGKTQKLGGESKKLGGKLGKGLAKGLSKLAPLLANPMFWLVLVIVVLFILVIIFLISSIAATNDSLESQNTKGQTAAFFQYYGMVSGVGDRAGVFGFYDNTSKNFTVIMEGRDPDDPKAFEEDATGNITQMNIMAGFKLYDFQTYNKNFAGDPNKGIRVKDMQLCIETDLPEDIKINFDAYIKNWSTDLADILKLMPNFPTNNLKGSLRKTVERDGRKVCWTPATCDARWYGDIANFRQACLMGVGDHVVFNYNFVDKPDISLLPEVVRFTMTGTMTLTYPSPEPQDNGAIRESQLPITPDMVKCINPINANRIGMYDCIQTVTRVGNGGPLPSGGVGPSGNPSTGQPVNGVLCPFEFYPENNEALKCTDGYRNDHKGIDWNIGANRGTGAVLTDRVIYSPVSGTVMWNEAVENAAGCGWAVLIKADGNTNQHFYIGHILYEPGKSPTFQQRVTQGQVLGRYHMTNPFTGDPQYFKVGANKGKKCWTGPHVHTDQRVGSGASSAASSTYETYKKACGIDGQRAIVINLDNSCK